MNTKYTLDEVAKNYKKLAEELGTEPTAHQIDACSYLPPSRTFQRRWGGLTAFREQINRPVTNLTSGITRTNKANEINARAKKYESKLYNQLHAKYHDHLKFTTTVIREYAWQQWLPEDKYYSNTKCDVAILTPEHAIIIDFFYPSDERNLQGCINAKLAKYKKSPVALYDCTHEVLLVCVNPDITHKSTKKSIKIIDLQTFQKRFKV